MKKSNYPDECLKLITLVLKDFFYFNVFVFETKQLFLGTLSYYDVTLDAVLSGHDSWVYSVTWNPNGNIC